MMFSAHGASNMQIHMGLSIYLFIYLSGFGRKASSQNVISEQEKCRKELEELKLEIQKCKFERDELYQILDFYICDDWDLR